MSLKIPKTGLAKRLREWMSGQSKAFDKKRVCLAFPEIGRARISAAISDCVRRKELIPVTKYNRRQYLYNRDWKKAKKGSLNKRIYKAMYVSGSFVAADVQRLAGVQDSGWVHKILRALKRAGLVQMVYRRPRTNGIGVEAVWHIPDRDRFKIECNI
jgi:hypothetical protein